MKTIYILTNFAQFLRSYSPIIVVADQLKMLKRGGYEPILIVSAGFEPPENSIFNQVKLVRLPAVAVSNDPKELTPQDETAVEDIYEAFKAAIPEDATVVTHDLIFLPDYVLHNIAARHLASDRPSISWIHWVHSATSPGSLIKERSMYGEDYSQLLNDKFPNSIIAFPNAFSIPRVARNFGYEETEVFEVPHPADLTEGMATIVKRLWDEKELGEADVVMVYPLRLDRGKNAEVNIKALAGFRRIGMDGRLVFCDFQSTGDDKLVYREDLKRLAGELGVSENITFLSEFDDSATMEVPHQVVLDLFTLSNVFIMPSKSETYSLITQEAMMRGNFCILNGDFAPFRQVFGQNAIYKPFSANIGFDGYDGEITTTHSNEDSFYDDLAKATKYYLDHDKVIRAKTWVRKERNHDAVFKHYFEPLLYRDRDE